MTAKDREDRNEIQERAWASKTLRNMKRQAGVRKSARGQIRKRVKGGCKLNTSKHEKKCK